MKNILVFILIVLVGVGVYFYFFKNTSSIDSLIKHFQSSGLSVSNVYISEKEKQAVEAFKGFITDLGAEDNTVVDSQLKYVNGIEVKITQYKSSKLAVNDYKQLIGLESRNKARAEQREEKYYTTEYFINKNFILTIRHYKTDSAFTQQEINIPKEKLDKLVEVFQKYK